MNLTPAELRAEYFRKMDAGEPIKAPAITPQSHAGDGSWHHPPAPAVAIDREADSQGQLEQILKAAGKMLGGWTLRAPDEQSGEKLRYMDGPDGGAFYARVDGWQQKGRIEFSGEWPRSEVDGYRYSPHRNGGTEYSSITVALSRSAEAIAGEIERRFLPGYLAEYAARSKDCEKRDVELREQTRIARRLADLMGQEIRYQCGRTDTNGLADHFYGGIGSALDKCEVSQSSGVKLTIDADENTAAAILRLIKRKERESD